MRTDLGIDEIITLLDNHNQKNVYGLICFHQIDFIQEKYLVYDRNDWFNFHRYFSGLYPISEYHFYNEIKKYFPDLFFHHGIESTLSRLEGGLFIFSKTIIKCLTALNDIFPKYFSPDSKSIDIPAILRLFSSESGINTTLEGNINRKDDLSFEFENNESGKTSEKLYCEPPRFHVVMWSSKLALCVIYK